jgi:hypothetical protein
MTDTPSEVPRPDAAEESSPLETVVDDDTPKIEAVEWAVEELYDDRPFEEVQADLVAGGWAPDDAAAVVEEARQRTRRHRGATTRDQVVLDADRMYRRATGRWFVGLPMLGAAWRLLHSVATLVSLRRDRKEGGKRA